MRLLTALILCFLTGWMGCASPSVSSFISPASESSSPKLTTPEGLAEYLRTEPTVRHVQAWDNPYGQGVMIETAHYRIHSTLLEPLMLRQVPSFLESAFRAYQSQLPGTLTSSKPLVVYLFGTRQQWETYTRDTAGDNADIYLQIQAGAYVADGVCVAYDIGRRQTFSVLGHEGWHQFTQQYFAYRLPSWLDEGIATLFETCRYERGRFVFEPTSNMMRLGTLKLQSLEGRLISLNELLVLHPGQMLSGYNGDPHGAASFYAQVYALVRFLREEGYGIRLRAYHAMLHGAAYGDWPIDQALLQIAADRDMALTVGWNIQISRALFAHYFGKDPIAMDDEYQAFCRKITYPIQLKAMQIIPAE
ncbi:MAG TPA: hypothetical protein ENN97_02205 [Phycisphaerales bacterium]|nr:hypothetical protein [Phycisphaerales bacterium]